MKDDLFQELNKGLYDFINHIKKESSDWNFKIIIKVPRFRRDEFYRSITDMHYTNSSTNYEKGIDYQLCGAALYFVNDIQYIEYQKIPKC